MNGVLKIICKVYKNSGHIYNHWCKMQFLDALSSSNWAAIFGLFQWRNRWGGVRVPPWHFSLGNFCWPTGKIEARGKWRRKKVNRKREGGKLKMEGGKVTLQNEERTFGNFLLGKKAFYAGKKIRKNDFAPLKNIPVTPLGSLWSFLNVTVNFTKLSYFSTKMWNTVQNWSTASFNLRFLVNLNTHIP